MKSKEKIKNKIIERAKKHSKKDHQFSILLHTVVAIYCLIIIRYSGGLFSLLFIFLACTNIFLALFYSIDYYIVER